METAVMVTSARQLADRFIDLVTGQPGAEPTSAERRTKKRVPYDALVAVILMNPDQKYDAPMALHARDISLGGICVLSRKMIYPGSRGAMQLVRSNGQMAIVGVQVQHCRYAGDMLHHVGFKFIPLTGKIDPQAFVDREGNMLVLDPALRPANPSAE